jgi:hypothetical protein
VASPPLRALLFGKDFKRHCEAADQIREAAGAYVEEVVSCVDLLFRWASAGGWGCGRRRGGGLGLGAASLQGLWGLGWAGLWAQAGVRCGCGGPARHRCRHASHPRPLTTTPASRRGRRWSVLRIAEGNTQTLIKILDLLKAVLDLLADQGHKMSDYEAKLLLPGGPRARAGLQLPPSDWWPALPHVQPAPSSGPWALPNPWLPLAAPCAPCPPGLVEKCGQSQDKLKADFRELMRKCCGLMPPTKVPGPARPAPPALPRQPCPAPPATPCPRLHASSPAPLAHPPAAAPGGPRPCAHPGPPGNDPPPPPP